MSVAEGCHRGPCCQLDAWEQYAASPHLYAEPLDSRIITLAWEAGIDPHLVDRLVEGEWGWESHDTGYQQAVERAVAQLALGDVQTEPA